MDRLPSSVLSRATVAWLTETGDLALANLASGTMTVNLSFSGKTVGKQVVVSPQVLLDAINTELRRRDPTTYGTLDTRTSATFS